MSSSMSMALIPYTPPISPMEFIRSIVEGNSGSKSISASVISPRLSPFVIFLDIDGVVYNRPNQEGVLKKAAELFPDITDPNNNRVCSIDSNSIGSIAASYFFDKKAVQNLNFLIGQIAKTRNVWIVVSSSWRENRSVEELRNTFFGIHEFSRYIVDKTPEKVSRKELGAYCPSKRHAEKYSLQCRAAEIQYWLNLHTEITNYIVLDDHDDHLLAAFGERFVMTNYTTLLTREICENILLQNVK